MRTMIVGFIAAVFMASCVSIPDEMVITENRANAVIQSYVPGQTTLEEFDRFWAPKTGMTKEYAMAMVLRGGYGLVESEEFRSEYSESIVRWVGHYEDGEQLDYAFRFTDGVLESIYQP